MRGGGVEHRAGTHILVYCVCIYSWLHDASAAALNRETLKVKPRWLGCLLRKFGKSGREGMKSIQAIRHIDTPYPRIYICSIFEYRRHV